VATFEIGVRGVNLIVLELIAKVMGAETIKAIMAAL